jgi:hypothetical protein
VKYYLPLLILSLLIISCGNDDYVPPPTVFTNKIQSKENLNKFYGPEMTNIYVRVFYEAGAEPYAGDNAKGQPVWGLLEQNIKTVFETRNQTVTTHVPKELVDMNQFADKEKESWTAQEIFDFSKTLGVPDSTKQTAYFSIIFLNGAFNTGEEVSNGTLGISITGTTVIAIFKDAIRRLGPSGESLTVKFGEQATLVHEMGHALGIVANGVDAVEDHHDEEHGSHCSNSSCVMYWMNEGNKDLLEFVQGIVQDGNVTLYGSQCLDDIKAYRP